MRSAVSNMVEGAGASLKVWRVRVHRLWPSHRSTVSCTRYAHSGLKPSGTSLRTSGEAQSRGTRQNKSISTPAGAIDRSATVHRCSRPHSNTWCTDARGHHGARATGRGRSTTPGLTTHPTG